LRESIKKNLEKPYKYPGEEKRKKKEREEKTWRNTLLIYLIVKV
jgi:hypothetical protein